MNKYIPSIWIFDLRANLAWRVEVVTMLLLSSQ